MLHLPIRLQAKNNPYLNNINPPLPLVFYLFISQISEEWADLNGGASGRGAKHGKFAALSAGTVSTSQT